MRSIFVLLLIAPTAYAGKPCYNNGHCNVARVVEVVEQREYVNIQNYYNVGADVRGYAVTPHAIATAQRGELLDRIEEIKDQLAEYDTQQSYSADAGCFRLVPCDPQAGGTPPQTNQPPGSFSLRQRQSVVQLACAQCHGQNGKARKHLDLTKWLTCDDIGRASESIDSDEMPKGNNKLTPDAKRALRAELFAWNKTNNFQEPQLQVEQAAAEPNPWPPQAGPSTGRLPDGRPVPAPLPPQQPQPESNDLQSPEPYEQGRSIAPDQRQLLGQIFMKRK